ncbi:MAG: class I SAM-dependent methyltransferase, partial [Phycisphaerae bacterium]|nr:class I SAM-dependent methyltransferase [Phycisphaerae bacterium]
MRSIGSKLRVKLASELSGRILDCGSGDDIFGSYLRRKGNEVISLDVDEKALKETPGTCVVASCAEMPFPDDYFDAVWSCAIIEHVEEESLPDMIRVTKPTGRV